MHSAKLAVDIAHDHLEKSVDEVCNVCRVYSIWYTSKSPPSQTPLPVGSWCYCAADVHPITSIGYICIIHIFLVSHEPTATANDVFPWS